uniref:Uncharacterized protein n=1 Tax=Chenopodium quinoa TaxID=63459 RepID=A0A803LXW6_CHEQI
MDVVDMFVLDSLQPGDEEYKWNPLHEAAKVGNVEIVKMFLDVYRCLPTLPSHLSERPWLLNNSRGDNPCFVATYNRHKECAQEIYKINPELISNMPSFRGCSLLFEAVHYKMSKLALEILRSPHFVNCGSELDNFTPCHSIHFIEGSEGSEEIFGEVLRRDQELIRQRDTNGDLAFHVWAYNGKIWPFKTFLKCDDIIQDVNKVFIDLVPSKDGGGDNLLHNLAECAPCKDEDAKKITELVIEVYKKNLSSLLDDQLLWLVKNKDGETPLSLAIAHKKEDFAKYILSVNENVVIEYEKNVLFLAIENECQIVAEEILKLVDNKGWTQLLTND